LLHMLPLATCAIRLIPRHGPSGRVAAAVEEVPRHDHRREPEVIAATEREIGTLEAVVQRDGHAGEERRGRRPPRTFGSVHARLHLTQLLARYERAGDAAGGGDVERQ